MGYNDYDGFDDDELDEGQGGSPKALREAQKAAAKRAKELEEQVNKLTSQLAERNLKDVLESKGLNPALGRFIIKDGVDATDQAAVDAWLGENGSLFGFKPQDASPAGEPEGPADFDVAADPTGELAAQYARMQSASQGALPNDRFQQATTELSGAKSLEDIQAVLNRAIKS